MRKQRLDAKTEYDIKYPDEKMPMMTTLARTTSVLLDRLLTFFSWAKRSCGIRFFQLAEPLADACERDRVFLVSSAMQPFLFS